MNPRLWAAAALAAGAVVASAIWGAEPEAPPPHPAAFTRTVLAGPLNEPVSLDVLDDGSVLFVERGGRVLRWREGEGVAELAVFDNIFASVADANEFGLLAISADPDFARNSYVYVMYDTKPGERPVQRVSRFTLADDRFDMSSERVVLEYPVDDNCCHTGGAIRFDAEGLLYIATGDNTNPWFDDGYGPIDNRPDRVGYDARRSAGNTNDLRGKILRIRVTADGGYEIPAGNLFADPAQGRPEIYVMGARNPYTMSIDPRTGALYYGDVGPDGTNDSPTRGSRGFDEINRVTEASNMGWPLFIGPNAPYHAHDYVTGESGAPFDPAHPINDSPRNTGARELPPARPALIWYPYGRSERWPLLGEGGRNALVAGVYRRPRGADDEIALPRYYEGKLIFSDFMRRWTMAATLNGRGEVASIEPFAPAVTLAAPLDFDFGPDGALYVIEYGSRWFQGNDDAALSRITYSQSAADAANAAARAAQSDDAPPVAALRADAASGAALVDQYGCLSCHQTDQASIGPSYREVAARYAARTDAAAYIAGRIAAGSSGNWGEQVMAGFDFIPAGERDAIAAYILSLRPHAQE